MKIQTGKPNAAAIYPAGSFFPLLPFFSSVLRPLNLSRARAGQVRSMSARRLVPLQWLAPAELSAAPSLCKTELKSPQEIHVGAQLAVLGT